MSTIEKYLKSNSSLTYWNLGKSMLPLIRENKDLFTIEKKEEGTRFKKYDVVLYHSHGKLILHRIVAVRDKDYVIMGDNTFRPEFGVKDEDILGRMVSFERNKRRYSVSNYGYRVYVRLWWALFPLRKLLHNSILCFKKVLRSTTTM